MLFYKLKYYYYVFLELSSPRPQNGIIRKILDSVTYIAMMIKFEWCMSGLTI